ncbi:hypothetical protein XavaCFBP5823_17865 [Xanthomonas axonopodis pv. vasculorum]|nr:hypothetical protein XavaCFBP5823_17865 [Xanthomonas axonopodis pv. vasculorum]
MSFSGCGRITDINSIAAHQYPPKSNQIVVIGAGIIGLTNALQLAKRGLRAANKTQEACVSR